MAEESARMSGAVKTTMNLPRASFSFFLIDFGLFSLYQRPSLMKGVSATLNPKAGK